MKIKLSIFALTLCFLLKTRAFAQAPVKRFCEILYIPGREFLYIDYGKIDKIEPFKDSTFVRKINLIKRMDNLISGMNYMTDLGWKFESDISQSTSAVIRILFSREFNLNEVNDTSSELRSSEIHSNY
jgi:hypothetical protein